MTFEEARDCAPMSSEFGKRVVYMRDKHLYDKGVEAGQQAEMEELSIEFLMGWLDERGIEYKLECKWRRQHVLIYQSVMTAEEYFVPEGSHWATGPMECPFVEVLKAAMEAIKVF